MYIFGIILPSMDLEKLVLKMIIVFPLYLIISMIHQVHMYEITGSLFSVSF